ncbi:MAG: B12-binding domain-containing radical SAM protein [Nitrospinota bacterium]|nr:B12-binding domain-containing radical SAM protein [Nitrospinota bacterium]
MTKNTRSPKKRSNSKIGPPATSARVLAMEEGHVIKPHGGRLKVALAYPNSYQVGMSNLGYMKVYHLLNRRDDVVCERVFFPPPQEAAWIGDGRGHLCSLESGLPLGKFDVIAFSITFEMDYSNALRMLSMAGVGGSSPLVMAGGIAVTMNPETMAERFHIMLIGEGEGIIDPLVDAIIAKGPIPAGLAGLPGVYVTGGYESSYGQDGRLAGVKPKPGYPGRVLRVWDKDAEGQPNLTRIFTPETVFGNMALVETGKGCGRHCRFCAAGYSYRPTRVARRRALMDLVDQALKRNVRVGLVGSAVADHPDLMNILEHIVAKGGRFSISSMRLDMITGRFLELCRDGGLKTITVAPEAGSERMRRIVNKDLPREKIIEAARLIGKTARFNLKLYFLVGLPWERDEDVEEIPRLVLDIRQAMVAASSKRGTTGNILVGVNGFIPKPWTPFQWAPFAGVKVIADKYKLVRARLRGAPNVKLTTGSAIMDYIQAILSMGDRRAGKLARMAAEMEGDWSAALKKLTRDEDPGFDPVLLAPGGRAPGEALPWEVVDYGMKEEYLEKDYEKAAIGQTVENCPPPGHRCMRCGVFDGVCIDAPGRDE